MIPQGLSKENMEQNPISQDILSLDTPWDRWVHRPPARIVAKVLSKTPTTPNQVTLLTLIPAAISAWYFTRANFTAGLWALFFFYLWSMLDHVDGELARLTGKTSEFGRKLDDTCDNIATMAILSGIFWGAIVLLDKKSQTVVEITFVIGLLLNVISGILVLKAKREVREVAVTHQKVTQRFVFFQKLIDLLTGRDPFYLLILVVLGSLYWQGPWKWVSISVLLAGVYFISFSSFTAWFKMRAKPALVS